MQTLKETSSKSKITKRKIGHHTVINEAEYRQKKLKQTEEGNSNATKETPELQEELEKSEVVRMDTGV